MALFHIILIKPSHYDDDGYVIQWRRSPFPSNSLAVLNGIALDCCERRVLGDDIDIRVTAIDETNTPVKVTKLARMIRRSGTPGLVGLVGVQTNQFPRALDLGRRFRHSQIPVCIGGFHVSGCLAMLPSPTPELEEARSLGISLFAGEVEGRFDTVLKDALHHGLQPVYNHLDELPNLDGAPAPVLPRRLIRRTLGGQSSVDAGRGCPFDCTFCTIINVQGRKSRYRSAEDVERVVRTNLEHGINRFFITDDNFARNRNVGEILDRLVELRKQHVFRLSIQVDSLAHKVPDFIAKAGRAGVRRVFIGLESINQKSLSSVGKRQNKISEYRRMLQAWRRIGVVTVAGHIIGFPHDTPESIVEEIETIKRELPVDLLHFLILTPMPGSEDHRRKFTEGELLEADLNSYDLVHVTTPHPTMSRNEWERAYRLAWETYYSDEHVETILRRAHAGSVSIGKLVSGATWLAGSTGIEGLDPLETGILRRRRRLDRRPHLPREGFLKFSVHHFGRLITGNWKAIRLHLRYRRMRKTIVADPTSFHYRDQATEFVPTDSIVNAEAEPMSGPPLVEKAPKKGWFK
ncbi:MAG: radical SAM protein [bacterium]|nr:radical SAM protein [bacterium]